MTTSVGCALFNYQSGGLKDGRYDFEPLKAELAEGPRVPALIKFCLTDPAARFWSVTRDFTKITCSRRGRGKGAPRVTRPHDGGEFGRSWSRRWAA